MITNTSPDDERTENGGKRRQKSTKLVRKNMLNHQKESEEIQPRDYTRNDHDIKESKENPKNAEAWPRQTDHTLGQAG